MPPIETFVRQRRPDVLQALVLFSCAAFGSFASTVAIRASNNASWFTGRSRCDGCGQALGMAELLPILSYACLGGRCRRCGAAIDFLHPAAEFASIAIGAVGLAVGGFEGFVVGASGLLWLAAALYDIKTLRIPNLLSAAVAALTISWACLSDQDVVSRLLSALLLGAGLSLLALAYRKRLGATALGGGDIKLAMASAPFVSPMLLPWALVLSGFAALVWVLMRRRHHGLHERTPFAPFLGFAFWWLHLIEPWARWGQLLGQQ